MPKTHRIGIQIGFNDPFWVQVREVMSQRAQTLPAELVEVDIQLDEQRTADERDEAVENLVAQRLDALICDSCPVDLLGGIIGCGLPVIYVSESSFRHPQFTSRGGLYEAAHMLGCFLNRRLAERPGPEGTTILISGGLRGTGSDRGQSRLSGFSTALSPDSPVTIHHVRSHWSYDDAHAEAAAYLSERPGLRLDVIFGLSDSLALAARDSYREQGGADERAIVLGINGDPLALAAIAEGSMAATVETDVDDIAAQAVELAYRAARGEGLPPTFQIRQRLVTASNVAEVAVRKLMSLANLPTRLVGVNRRTEQQRVVQLETSLAINRQVGLILDKQRLSLTITDLIRDSYGYDLAQLLIWDSTAGVLAEVGGSEGADAARTFRPDPAGPLAYALAHNRGVFTPDMQASRRFAPDPAWPETRARAVVPVRLGGEIVGLLDLHCRKAEHHARRELDGLQLLADQLGIAMRNAELYGQALEARAAAEKANQLKTRLLANVSHELRAPLNVILGYSRAALEAGPRQDMLHISRSGEHLLRLINDLLDLSRAEIDELDLLPEAIDTRSFLEELFQSSAEHLGVGADVAWELDLPPELPAIEADPVRLRQVLLNLLHNANKFTRRGRITLGAEVAPPHLHLWVADTGAGIPSELREQVFEPFVSVDAGPRRREGIGLGLSIARRLVMLHRGELSVESAPGRGSTFHVYLPLPAERPRPAAAQEALLLLADTDALPAEIVRLAERRGLTPRRLCAEDHLPGAIEAARPALVALSLSDAAPESWELMQQLREHPQIRQLPTILYQRPPEQGPGVATGLLLKPLSERALIDAIENLHPEEASGSILIVDDDPETRGFHRRIIAEHLPGYSIRETGGGRAALELLACETPSLVVLDLVMPDVDGFAVLEALRASPRTRTVPVLVISGKALSSDDIRRLADARAVFQAKDLLSEDELAGSLRRALASDDALPPHTSALVKRAIAVIQQRYAEPLSRQAIADAVGVSKDYLGRIFSQELGLAPWEYLTRYRVLRAKELLRAGTHSVAAVAARVGFDDAAYFSRVFHREVGCSPRDFARGGAPASREGRFSPTSARDSA